MKGKKIPVTVSLNLFCDWHKSPPTYRLFVNDELLTERTYIWKNSYLHEVLPLELLPGIHKIQLNSLAKKAKFHIRNLKVNKGPVNIIDSTTFEVLECEQ